MDIEVYDNLVKGLQSYNDTLFDMNYGNKILSDAPMNPTYPMTIIEEIRNDGVEGNIRNVEKVANLGYRVDIYAKTKKGTSKKTIARILMKQIDTYFNIMNFTQISYNPINLENDNSLYHIVLVYSVNYFENRKILI